MQFTDVVAARRMVRRYRDAPVAAAVLERVATTALQGPSAGFSQGVRLVVVMDTAQRRRIAAICGEDEHVAAGRTPWLSVAPAHVVLAVRENDYRERYVEADKARARGPDGWSAPYWWVDAGAALMLLLLAAVDEGLGAGVLDIAQPDRLRALLKIPDDVAPVCLVTLGYPAEGPQPAGSSRRGRRPADSTIWWERWGANLTGPAPAAHEQA